MRDGSACNPMFQQGVTNRQRIKPFVVIKFGACPAQVAEVTWYLDFL